jgi:SAM-dependent methyltransferase
VSLASFYEAHVLPRLIDVACSDGSTGRWREQICADLSGEVLEFGFGSGTNLRHYPSGVDRVLAVEPSDLAWRRASRAVAGFARPVERIGLDGASVALADASVDAVVSTYTMCTIPDLGPALAEARRVLRPGGRLHFVEHGLSPDAEVRDRQRRWEPRWSRVAGGCHLTRDIPDLVGAAGFEVEDLDQFYMPGPSMSRPFGWLSVGRAVPA